MYRVEEILFFMMQNRWMLFQIFFLLYLIILSCMDIRRRKLSLRVLLAGAPAAVISGIFASEIPAALLIAGGAVGLGFLAVSKVSGEALGYGDSILITILGTFLGFWNILSVLMAAFLLAAVFSAVMLARRGFTRKSSFPFVPFLAAAYIGAVLTGGF